MCRLEPPEQGAQARRERAGTVQGGGVAAGEPYAFGADPCGGHLAHLDGDRVWGAGPVAEGDPDLIAGDLVQVGPLRGPRTGPACGSAGG